MDWREPHWLFRAPRAALGLVAFVLGCGGGGGDVAPPPTPAAISISSGNQQTGAAGAVLPQPIAARVTSASGAGIEGVSVNFGVAASSGSVSTGAAVTNADGVASTTWTVGTKAGINVDTVRASVSGVNDPAIYTASVTAAAAASLAAVSGNSQGGIPGQPLAQPLVVLAQDQFSNPKSHVDVVWTVTSGGGTVSPSTGTTGADGLTSAIWTPGNAAVNTVQAAVLGLASPVSFGATATTNPSRLSLVSGDGQTGSPSQLLAQPLVVSLRTQSGTPVIGVAVSWAVTGGGTVSQASVPTDGLGQSSILWTLGPSEGQQSATASVGGATGSPVSFSATAVASSGVVTLTAVSPTPIVVGQPATLTGSGFSSTAANNAVTIDGVTATVTAASAISLTVSVPHSNCQPARRVPVQVMVGGEASNVLSQDLNPSSFTTVGVGQQLLLQNGEFCLQFPSSTSAEEYLIGVQSTSEVVTSLTPATLTAVTAGASAAIAPLPELANRSAVRAEPSPSDRGAAHRRARHYGAESKRLGLELVELKSKLSHTLRPRALSAASRASIPSEVAVGDVVSVRVRNTSCSDFRSILAVVKVVGTTGVWVEDLDNPADGLSESDIQSLSDLLDGRIYPTDVDYFGSPSDLDNNGRIVVVVTKEVNRQGNFLGFVSPTDLLGTTVCEASNQGEIFYLIAPDPTGVFAFGTYTREQAMHDAISTIAHEFTHIIQVSRRIVLNIHPLPAHWTAEGQARFAEEVVGYQFEGRRSGQNYGSAVAFNEDDPSSIDWYSDRFFELSDYFGFETPTSKIPGAPEECSWLDQKPTNPGPCLGGADIYGTPWSLLRWVTDQFGPTFPGGEKGLHRALIDDSGVGYENIANVAGVSINTLLAEWAAALYADDRVPGLDPRLTLSSWNLFDIFDGRLVEAAHLVPRLRGFASFTDQFSVRAGSSAYFRVSGATHPSTAIRVRSNSDGQLPSIMQVFVVRLR